MPESRSDLLKISPELISGRMWHDPQNCSFPELEESVSILSKVHPLQPEEKKVRQKTSTVAQTTQQPENITRHPGASSQRRPGHCWEHLARRPSPERAGGAAGVLPVSLRVTAQRAPARLGRVSRVFLPTVTWPVVCGWRQEVSHLCVFQSFCPLHVQSSE